MDADPEPYDAQPEEELYELDDQEDPEEPEEANPRKRKRKKRGPGKEQFARQTERVARALGADAVVVAPMLGTGLQGIFVTIDGETSKLDRVPDFTTREAYAFLLGLGYPRSPEEEGVLGWE